MGIDMLPQSKKKEKSSAKVYASLIRNFSEADAGKLMKSLTPELTVPEDIYALPWSEDVAPMPMRDVLLALNANSAAIIFMSNEKFPVVDGLYEEPLWVEKNSKVRPLLIRPAGADVLYVMPYPEAEKFMNDNELLHPEFRLNLIKCENFS